MNQHVLPGLVGDVPQQQTGQEDHEKIFILVLELTNPDQVNLARVKWRKHHSILPCVLFASHAA